MNRYSNRAERLANPPQGSARIMADGQVAHLHEVGDTEPVVIFDSHGDNMLKKPSWMARVDAKGSEKIELSKGTIAVFTLAPAFLMLMFSYGGSALGWAREDQTQKIEIQQLKNQLQEVRDSQRTNADKLDKLTEMIVDQKIQDAKVSGYRLGQTDAGATGHKNK